MRWMLIEISTPPPSVGCVVAKMKKLNKAVAAATCLETAPATL